MYFSYNTNKNEHISSHFGINKSSGFITTLIETEHSSIQSLYTP